MNMFSVVIGCEVRGVFDNLKSAQQEGSRLLGTDYPWTFVDTKFFGGVWTNENERRELCYITRRNTCQVSRSED